MISLATTDMKTIEVMHDINKTKLALVCVPKWLLDMGYDDVPVSLITSSNHPGLIYYWSSLMMPSILQLINIEK